MPTAILVRADLTHERIDFPARGLTLPVVKRALDDGDLELIQVQLDGELISGYIDEEGKRKGLPLNPLATALFITAHGPIDVIVGPCLFMAAAPDAEGYERGLTPDQVAALESLASGHNARRGSRGRDEEGP